MNAGSPRIRPHTRQQRRELFEEAAAILAFEHVAPPNLPALARRLATSPRQLQRTFEEHGHGGLRGYLTHVRTAHAAQLLNDGASVQDAAHAVGYRQAAQFTRAFRQQRGELPSQFKARARPQR